MYIVSSGNGYFVKFDNDSPLMDSDPLCAMRMEKGQTAGVIERLEELGFVGELVKLILARMPNVVRV